jgi:hypothetical protein
MPKLRQVTSSSLGSFENINVGLKTNVSDIYYVSIIRVDAGDGDGDLGNAICNSTVTRLIAREYLKIFVNRESFKSYTF